MTEKKPTKSVLSQSTALTSGSAMALGALMAKDSQKRQKSREKSKDVLDISASVEGSSTVADTASIKGPVDENARHDGIGSTPVEVPKDRQASRKKTPDPTKSVLSQSTELKSGSAMALASLMPKESSSKRAKDTDKAKESQKSKVVQEANGSTAVKVESNEHESSTSVIKPIEPTKDKVESLRGLESVPGGTIETQIASTHPSSKKQDLPKSVQSQSTMPKSDSAKATEPLAGKKVIDREEPNMQQSREPKSIAVAESKSHPISDVTKPTVNSEMDIWKEVPQDRSRDTHQFNETHIPSPDVPDSGAQHVPIVDLSVLIPVIESRAKGLHRNMIEVKPETMVVQDEKKVLHHVRCSKEEACSWKCCSHTDNDEMELYSRPRYPDSPDYDLPKPASFLQRYCKDPLHSASLHVREYADELGQELFEA